MLVSRFDLAVYSVIGFLALLKMVILVTCLDGSLSPMKSVVDPLRSLSQVCLLFGRGIGTGVHVRHGERHAGNHEGVGRYHVVGDRGVRDARTHHV